VNAIDIGMLTALTAFTVLVRLLPRRGIGVNGAEESDGQVPEPPSKKKRVAWCCGPGRID
jgi:hypothetical protein